MPLRVATLLSSLGTTALVVAGTVGLLTGLDGLPNVLTASTRERTWASVNELERSTGHRLALPSYFPASLRWPPTSIRTMGRGPRAAVLGLMPKEGGAERFFIAQTLDGPGEIPTALLPHGVVVDAQAVRLDEDEAQLRRLHGADGFVWHEVAWTHGGQTLVLRSRGTVEQLMRMADSVRREGHE